MRCLGRKCIIQYLFTQRFGRILSSLFIYIFCALSALFFKTALSNSFPDASDQKAFLVHLLTHIHPLVHPFTLISDTQSLMAFLGLTDASCSHDEEHVNNRKRLQFCVNMILGLLKRTNNKSILLPEVVPLINSLIPITRFLNEMWEPSLRRLCDPSFAGRIFVSATDGDRNHLLEFVQTSDASSSDPTSSNKQVSFDRLLQSFLWSLHENLFTLLGSCCCYLPTLVFPRNEAFLSILLTKNGLLFQLPRVKLRNLVKHFVKPFVQNCPHDQISLTQSLEPLSSFFIPCLFKHIDDRWEVYRLNSMTTSSSGVQDKATRDSSEADKFLENEVIEDQSNRLLSREFVDVFLSLLISTPKETCLSGSPVKGTAPNSRRHEDDDDEMMADTQEVASPDSNEPTISEAGKMLLQKDLQSWTRMAFAQLTWDDSYICQRISPICRLIMKLLLTHGIISSADDVSFFLSSLFLSLRLFRENEQSQTILVQMVLNLYEGLVKESEQVKAPFWILSSSDQMSWAKFEKSFIVVDVTESKASGGKYNDKRKREAMKPLLTHVIGVSLAHLSLLFSSFHFICYL